MTGIIDNTKSDERERWVQLLHSCWMYHQQQIKELESPIIGKELTDEQLRTIESYISYVREQESNLGAVENEKNRIQQSYFTGNKEMSNVIL